VIFLDILNIFKIHFFQQFHKILNFFNIDVIRNKNLIELREYKNSRAREDLNFLTSLKSKDSEKLLSLMKESKSQLRQDLFVLAELNYKKNGYFIEFGAANGVELSNTYLLETAFNWTGILAEPAKYWTNELLRNRPNARIEELCVWKESNKFLDFNETKIPEISTIDLFSKSDAYESLRKKGSTYKVKTISLYDLLIKHSAPQHIDYLSIDTEGSEFEILSSFNFNEFTFGVITCEHNYSDTREKIHDLLAENGYERKFTELSDFDDWYVLN
jgi:FkbM family methyltransferase